MKRYLFIVLAIALSMLGIFFLAQLIGIPILTDPMPWLERGGSLTGLITTGLLIVDVFLPIPSSLVMIANGAIFGVVLGTIFSVAGSMGMALLGYRLGASGSKIINRFIPQREQERAKILFERWGTMAVIVTRPVPILAETVSIVAGISAMSLRRYVLASIAGIIPASVLYAYVGARAVDAGSSMLAFAIVVSIAGAFWFIGRRAKRKLNSGSQTRC